MKETITLTSGSDTRNLSDSLEQSQEQGENNKSVTIIFKVLALYDIADKAIIKGKPMSI